MPTTRRAILVGRPFGVELKLDASWLLVFGLMVWTLTSVFAEWHPRWTTGTVLASAIVTGLAFFASLLLHELAHVVVAKAYGLPVRDITLHLFGGVANIEKEPPTPSAELLIAAAGPIASLVLGGSMLALASLSSVTLPTSNGDVASTMSPLGPTTTLLVWLGPVNIAIALFNLLPGFPMDGGRILRAILWKVTGDLTTATRWSTWAGRGVGLAFIAAGFLMTLGVHVPFFGTGFGSGLWLGLIGLFVRGAAKRHLESAELATALEGVTITALMRPAESPVRGAPGNASVRSLVDDWFVRREEDVLPVLFGERLIGMVTLGDIAAVPPAEWDTRTAREIMRSPASFPAIGPSDPVLEGLSKLRATGLTAAPVFEAGELVGILSVEDVTRWVSLHRAAAKNTPVVRPRYV